MSDPITKKPQNKKRKIKQQKEEDPNLKEPKKKKFLKNNNGLPKETKKDSTKDTQLKGKKKEKQEFKSKKPKKDAQTTLNDKNEDDLDFNTEDGKNMILITKMNKIATKLFSKQKEDPSQKFKLIENILKKIGAILPKLINKRSASKFFQACYKFGNQSQKDRIFNSIKGSDLSEVFKSKYGHFLLLKIAKKGTKEQKKKIFDEILKNAWFFVSHKEAGQVIDKFLKSASNQQIHQIKEIFKIKANEKTERLENAAMRIIEKDIINYQLSQYVLSQTYKILIPNEKEKIFEKVKEDFLGLGKTKEGLILALEIINHANNKQKKTLIKSLKGKVYESIIDNDKKFMIILKIINSVDDREVLNKYLLKEINSNLDNLLKNDNGISIISCLVIPKHNILESIEGKNITTTCKKDDAVRREEILSIIMPNLITSLQKDLVNYLKTFSLSRVISTLTQIICSNEEYYENHNDFLENVFQCFHNEINAGFKSLDAENINNSYLITQIDANRVLKNLIRLSNEVKIEDAKNFLESQNEIIYEFLIKNLVLYIRTRLIFLVISLIENTNYKEALIEKVKKIKNKIPESTQGYNILKQII